MIFLSFCRPSNGDDRRGVWEPGPVDGLQRGRQQNRHWGLQSPGGRGPSVLHWHPVGGSVPDGPDRGLELPGSALAVAGRVGKRPGFWGVLLVFFGHFFF